MHVQKPKQSFGYTSFDFDELDEDIAEIVVYANEPDNDNDD